MMAVAGLPKAELADLSFETGCIQRLIEKGDEKDTANFNRASLVMASFIKDKGYAEKEYGPILDQMAANTTSTSYKTKSLRLKHLKAAVHTALNNSRIRFAKTYLYAIIQPCGKCALCQSAGLASDPDDVESDTVDRSGIRSQVHMYVKGLDEDARPLTNFTIKVKRIYMVENPDTHQFVREKADVILEHPGGETPIVLYDEAFLAKASFGHAILGVSNLIFKGSEADLAAVKEYVFSHAEEAEVIYTVQKYGINVAKVEGGTQEFLVYAEPEYSISMTGALNQYQVPTSEIAYPRFKDASTLDDTSKDFIGQTLRYLLKINRPEVLAPILGWFMAAFFKVHVGARFANQFPLLHIYGNAGSGKTATAELLAYLHGLDYSGKDSILNLSSSSLYAVKHTMASSTTVARVFDELNAGKVRHFDQVCELLKQCWTSQASIQGTVARSNGLSHTKLKQFTLSGPICTLGEQQLETPALNERIVQVHLSGKGRLFEGAKTSFSKVNAQKKHLTSLGKPVMLRSLRTSAREVFDVVEECMGQVPSDLSDRPRLGRAILLMGLRMLETVAKESRLNVVDDLQELRAVWERDLNAREQVAALDVFASEVDRVLDYMAKLVSYEDDPIQGSLRREYEFMVVQDHIYLDLSKAMLLYRKHARSSGLPAVFNSATHMRKHLEEEDYFKSYKYSISATGQRVEYAVLSIQKMLEKGINANYFLSEDDDLKLRSESL